VSIDQVAYDALNLGRQNARDIENHEKVCAERYAGIHTAIGELKISVATSNKEFRGNFWKAGSLAFTIILGMLGFMLSQQFAASNRVNDDQQRKIERLMQQLADERANPARGSYERPEAHR